MNISVNQLFNVKDYPAGKAGNLLTFFVEDLAPVVVVSPKGAEKPVQVMCCTATVNDEETQAYLKKMCDRETPSDKVILVSKKFSKLWNKTQLALLTIENCKASSNYCRDYASAYDADTGEVFSFDQNGTIIGEVLAIERYGKIRAVHAINKAQRYQLKSVWNASNGLHHAARKGERAQKQMNQMQEQLRSVLASMDMDDAMDNVVSVQ